MTTLALPLPRLRKIPKPPKALILKAVECLCWAFWTIGGVIGCTRHRYWEVVWIVLYGKWMAESYRELITMIEAWIDDRPVKSGFINRGWRPSFWFVLTWTLIWAPIDILLIW